MVDENSFVAVRLLYLMAHVYLSGASYEWKYFLSTPDESLTFKTLNLSSISCLDFSSQGSSQY